MKSLQETTKDIVRQHYARAGIAASILSALAEAGKDVQRLTPADLAPVDQFHVRGRAATLELARVAGIDASMRVLDVGCGIGGTTRGLAAEFGCHVTGIDLTDEYCRAAVLLSERVGLSDRVGFRQADATRLPFEAGSFDLVWTEHVAMNIAD
ncbi:MAG TPA: methyltransferase domain-containing protein, partial [Rhodocyclaceae bacterium]